MNRLVTIALVASSAVFVVLGILALTGGIWLWGAILLVAGGMDLAMTLRMRRQAPKPATATPARSPPPASVPPPVPVPVASSLRALPEPVTVCPRCGFLAIRASRTSGGSYAGGGALLSSCYCPRCAYEGLPIRFERRADYAEFVQALHADGPAGPAGT